MKKFLTAKLTVFISILAITLSLMSITGNVAWADGAYPTPNPNHYVTDNEGLLTVSQIDDLDSILGKLEAETSIQVAVVTVASFGGESAKNYAIGIGDSWGVGQKGKDNGVVFLLSSKERKVWIQYAQGLNSVIRQGKIDSIVDDTIIPRCKQSDYSGAIMAGVEELADYLMAAGSNSNPTTAPQSSHMSPAQASDTGPADLTVVWIVLGILAGILIVCSLVYFIQKHMAEKNDFRQDLEERIKSLKRDIDFVSDMEAKYSKELWPTDSGFVANSADMFQTQLQNIYSQFDEAQSMAELVQISAGPWKNVRKTVDAVMKPWKIREKIESALKSAQSQIGKIPTMKAEVGSSLNRMKAKYPKEIWEDWENGYNQLPGSDSLEKEYQDIIGKLPMMLFAEMEVTLARAEELYHRSDVLTECLNDLSIHENEVDEAYEKGPSKLKEIEELLAEERKSAPSSARKHYDSAREHLASARTISGGGSPNWWLILPLLASATHEYHQGEEIRREANESSHRSSYHSSYNDNNHSSGGSMGFGGFGGGGGFSGGGGGGGSW